MAPCNNCRLPVEATTTSDDDRTLCQPCGALLEDDSGIRLVPLGRDDIELVFAWRSNSEIHRHFRRQDELLDWHEHVTWFESRSSDRHDFVIHYDGRRVGVVSLDTDDSV